MAIIQPNPKCHYSGTPYPAQLADKSEHWFHLYRSLKAEAAYFHAKHTMDLAMDYGIIEPKKIGDRNLDSVQMNLKVANACLSTGFLDTQQNRARFPAEIFSMHPFVVEGFGTFNAYHENDLKGQDRSIYAALLEKRSGGTLAILPDTLQYLNCTGMEKALSGLDPSVFHTIDRRTWRRECEQKALAAHNIYGPIAEFFGYTRLAGDLDQMSFYFLHRDFYHDVFRALKKMSARVERTKQVMGIVVSQLKYLLGAEGYDCDILPRDHKHPGRVMEKVDRKMRQGGGDVAEHVAGLKDLAAFTVVLHSYKDSASEVGQRRLERFHKVGEMVASLVRGLRPVTCAVTDYVSAPKPNGYQSLHVDMAFPDQGLVGMEAIIRNSDMHWRATNGGAAHYIYKGGGPSNHLLQKAFGHLQTRIREGGDKPAGATHSRATRLLNVWVEGEGKPRQVVVPAEACIGEALICAGIDPGNGFMLSPPRSLTAPLGRLGELALVRTERHGQMLSGNTLQLLIGKALLPETREALLKIKRQRKKDLDAAWER